MSKPTQQLLLGPLDNTFSNPASPSNLQTMNSLHIKKNMHIRMLVPLYSDTFSFTSKCIIGNLTT